MAYIVLSERTARRGISGHRRNDQKAFHEMWKETRRTEGFVHRGGAAHFKWERSRGGAIPSRRYTCPRVSGNCLSARHCRWVEHWFRPGETPPATNPTRVTSRPAARSFSPSQTPSESEPVWTIKPTMSCKCKYTPKRSGVHMSQTQTPVDGAAHDCCKNSAGTAEAVAPDELSSSHWDFQRA